MKNSILLVSNVGSTDENDSPHFAIITVDRYLVERVAKMRAMTPVLKLVDDSFTLLEAFCYNCAFYDRAPEKFLDEVFEAACQQENEIMIVPDGMGPEDNWPKGTPGIARADGDDDDDVWKQTNTDLNVVEVSDTYLRFRANWDGSSGQVMTHEINWDVWDRLVAELGQPPALPDAMVFHGTDAYRAKAVEEITRLTSFEPEDQGCAKIAEFHADDQPDGLFVRLHSWSDKKEHARAEALEGKPSKLVLLPW